LDLSSIKLETNIINRLSQRIRMNGPIDGCHLGEHIIRFARELVLKVVLNGVNG
jgi:hypothetical protein